ncbi:MAG: ribosome biogenesis factor YjgA [Mariprofundaceae bacterium]
MHDVDSKFSEDPEYTGPSKSEKKRQVQALQQLGEKLIKLSDSRLVSLELPEDLYQAIAEAKQIQHKHAAFKRQRKFIGKIMRQIDTIPIQQAIAELEENHYSDSATFHRSEQWRERLLSESQTLSDFIGQYPQTDRQQLQQLLQKAQREHRADSGKGAQRSLFRFLHKAIEASV